MCCTPFTKHDKATDLQPEDLLSWLGNGCETFIAARDWWGIDLWRQCGWRYLAASGHSKCWAIPHLEVTKSWAFNHSHWVTGSLGHWVVVESPISHWSSVAASDWGASVETTNPPWALELKVSPRRLKQRCLVQIPHCYRGRLASLPGN